MLSVLSSKPIVLSVHRTFCICPREYTENELFPYHCLIVKCRGTYQQQTLSNSRTRKFDQKVLQEQFLFTSGIWCIHLNIFFWKWKNNTFHCVFLIFFRIFKIFVMKFYHEKALIKWTKTHKSKLEEKKIDIFQRLTFENMHQGLIRRPPKLVISGTSSLFQCL